MSFPHPATLARAHMAIGKGMIHHGEWSMPAMDDREQSDCLGIGCSYPVFAGGKLSTHALANAESRAVTAGHPEIATKARELLGKIRDKPQTMAASDDDEPVKGLFLSYESQYRPALTLGSNLPTTRNTKPVAHFWKEALRPGHFQDASGNEWDFSPLDMKEIVADHKRAMKLASHEPSLDERHPTKTNPSRGKNYGWVIDSRVNDRGRLELLHQFVGKDETNEALNKKSSILLIPGKKDHLGNQYKWWIEQNAIVSNAQLRDLDPEFKPVLAASGQPVEAVYLSLADTEALPQEDNMPDLSGLKGALGLSGDKPDVEVLALAATEVTQLRSKLKEAVDSKLDTNLLRRTFAEGYCDGKTDQQVLALAAEQMTAMAIEFDRIKTDLETANQRAVVLSSDTPPIDKRLRRMMVDNIKAARQTAFSRGWTPASLSPIDEIFGDNEPNDLALSSEDESGYPIAYRVYNALGVIGEGILRTENHPDPSDKPIAQVSRPAKDLALSDDKPGTKMSPERKAELLAEHGAA